MTHLVIQKVSIVTHYGKYQTNYSKNKEKLMFLMYMNRSSVNTNL